MSKDYIHGLGKLTYNNGYIFYGNFSFSIIDGNGSLHGISKNLIYCGNWSNGVFHGKGKLYHENRKKFFSGLFLNGVCDGYGKIYDFDEVKLYEGEISKGEFSEYVEDTNIFKRINDLIKYHNTFLYKGCLKEKKINIDAFNINNNYIEIEPSAPPLI